MLYQSFSEKEKETGIWYVLKFNPLNFGVFDTFETKAGWDAPLSTKDAVALMAGA